MNGRARSKRVTLANVAELAGVSTTAVSLILSERPDYIGQFNSETVARVRKSAETLGYRTNLFASGLPIGTSPFFALVIRDLGRFDSRSWHPWAFEGNLVTGAIEAGNDAGLYPILATISNKPREADLTTIERLITGGVFGAIVRSPHAPLETFLRKELRRGLPILALFPDVLSKWPGNAISVDNVKIGELAGQMLAAEDRKRWGIVKYNAPRMRESHKLRIEGFKRIAAECGVQVNTNPLPRDLRQATKADFDRLESANVDGLFGLDSVLSIDALLACQNIGRQPGEDCSLVGVNCSSWPSGQQPTISSIDVSWRKAGAVALRQLSKLAESDENLCENIYIDPEIALGDTCPVPDTLDAQYIAAAK